MNKETLDKAIQLRDYIRDVKQALEVAESVEKKLSSGAEYHMEFGGRYTSDGLPTLWVKDTPFIKQMIKETINMFKQKLQKAQEEFESL